MTRVALITGAAGGIGSATSRVFKEAGWRVVGVDIRGDDDAGDDFLTVDISDPAAPFVAGTLLGVGGWSVAVDGGFAYVTDNSRLAVVKISNPTKNIKLRQNR